jgi:hypothetical protein
MVCRLWVQRATRVGGATKPLAMHPRLHVASGSARRSAWPRGRRRRQTARPLRSDGATRPSPRYLRARIWPVRRKNSIPRLGQRRLRDARSDSANDDGLPAVVGARQVAGDRHASTAEYSHRLGDAGSRWCPRPTSLPSATHTSTRPGCSGSDAVLVVKPAEHRPAAHRLRRYGPYRWQPSASRRRLHSQPPVRATVVVPNVLAQDAFGVEIVEHDHVVEALSPQGLDQPGRKMRSLAGHAAV